MNRELPYLRPARLDETTAALELLLSVFNPDERPPLAAALARELNCNAGRVAGLVVAERNARIEGVSLAQLHPGRTASVWRPRFTADADDSPGAALVRQCVAWLATRETRVNQSLLETDDEVGAQWLVAAGFARIARLAYLVWNATDAVADLTGPSLRFESVAPETAASLSEIVEQSYHGTLDCPTLNGVRSMADVLEGYRTIGHYRPELWRFAYRGAQPVGCVLVAEHSDSNQCELVYMGVIPGARGQGFGRELIAEAQRLTAALFRTRLVLAVDLANHPALTLYHRAGFRVWDQREVFVQLPGGVVATVRPVVC